MTRFLLRKLLRAAFTLWFIVTVVFFVTRLSGDPMQYLLPDDATDAQFAQMEAFLGLDQPLSVQYRRYLAAMVQGDFGTSFFARRPVLEIYAERIVPTLQMAIPAFLLAIAIGIPAGLFAALHRNSATDRALMSIAFVGQALPNFVLGITLILVFSLTLQWLPSGGRTGFANYIMPTITLGTASAAIVARLTRSGMLDVIRQDYMRAAAARGLPRHTVVLKHGLRNGVLPVLTILGLMIGDLIAGSVIVETVFAWPGAGRLVIDAVLNRDDPLVQFAILATAVIVILANLSVDVLYGVLDPRMRER